MNAAVHITMYLIGNDKCRRILEVLRKENVAGASVGRQVRCAARDTY